MRDRLRDALKKSNADYCEIRFEESEGVSLAFRGKEMESADAGAFSGGIVRACVKGGWGLVSFDSLDALQESVAAACHCAKLVSRDKTQLAEIEIEESEYPAELEQDFREIALEDKIELIRAYNEIVMGAGPSIASSQVRYEDRFRRICLATSDGHYHMEERPLAGCLIIARARDGSMVQTAHDSWASPLGYGVVQNREEDARKIADRAMALLKAPKVEGGPQTVILNPMMGGVFVHEAFGHLSEADFLSDNPRLLEQMQLGRKLGPDFLNVVDGAAGLQTVGSLRFDEEGTPAHKTYLIRDGILSSHLHSRETAAKMGEEPTGNARAVSRGHGPIVRMTNTYIESGESKKEALFEGIDKGVYACDAFGGQTQFEMFTFSAGYGYRIENGEVGELVRDVVLTGNVFQTLNHIDALANDMEMLQGLGGCGKEFQSPLPVGFGTPHMRIRDVVIG
ncbi:MAG: TldD/PmbA family protein [Candidatus Sumerlaeia bacterium]